MSGEQYDVYLENYIDGEFVPTGEYMDSEDPSVGKPWARIPNSNAEDVAAAVAAAKRAFPSWSAATNEYRSSLMMKVAALLEERMESFAVAESRDQGKPVWLARVMDIPRAVLNLREFATAIKHQTDECHQHKETGTLNYVTRTAAGVAGLIAPWNLPLYLLTFKLGPALASGCTVVAKPSEMTSVTAWMFCKVLTDAGFPKGVVNMVFGTGARVGEAIVRHPDVALVSFTGSTVTAEHIQKAAAGLNKKLSLELGGKNAAVVFSDADIADCVSWCVRSSFTNQGEVCLCTSRIFVQESVYDKFVEDFVKQTRTMKVGDPRDPATKVGALISRDHFNKVHGYVSLCRDEGATIQCGEGTDDKVLPEDNQNGYFMLPTVITDLPDTARAMQEEIFGPVTCIVPFKSEDEVIERANNVKYGLCATLWTSNVNRAHRVANKLEVGTVWVNCWLQRDLIMPFGGTKASGEGREGTKDSFDFYTEKKTISMKIC